MKELLEQKIANLPVVSLEEYGTIREPEIRRQKNKWIASSEAFRNPVEVATGESAPETDDTKPLRGMEKETTATEVPVIQ